MPARLLLIVDDHEQFGAFVERLLDGNAFHVVGVADSGEHALDAVDSLHPEVVLLDIQLPGIDGFEVAERLSQTSPPPTVVLTSTRDATDFGARLANAPVAGFIPKQQLSADAVAALVGHA